MIFVANYPVPVTKGRMNDSDSISLSLKDDKSEKKSLDTSGTSVVDGSVVDGGGGVSIVSESLASTAERAIQYDEYNNNDNNDDDDATVDEQEDDNDDTTVATGMNTAVIRTRRASRRNDQQRQGLGDINTTTRRKKKAFSSQAEENAHKIREAFYILTQGVDIMQYKAGSNKRKGDKIRQVIWLEPELLRICVDSRRITSADVQRSVTGTGLFLRDIAEIRGGCNAFAFRNSVYPPENDNFCLSLIGTETTICIEFPTQFIRDWFLVRFHLVMDDVLSEEEQDARAKRNLRTGMLTGLSFEESAASQQMLALLKRGIQIHHHNHHGSIVRSMIFYDHDMGRLCLRQSDNGLFSFFSGGSISASVAMSDIAEVRPGSHSYGFVLTDSTDKSSECMSIVGTECSLDLQLANSSARDLFSQRMRLFIRFWELNFSEDAQNDQENDEEDEEKARDEDEDVDENIVDDTEGIEGNMTNNIETELDTGLETNMETDREGATRLGVIESASGFSASGWESGNASGSDVMALGYESANSLSHSRNISISAANAAAYKANNDKNINEPTFGLDAATRERLRNLRLVAQGAINGTSSISMSATTSTSNNNIHDNDGDDGSSSIHVDVGSVNQSE